ncbi:MAG: hypothetical protein HPY76_08970 [Anaerolineae bacterium]|jgi:hypothetical protein|nr:hypothetical protein [Anaerolineae bacterium]
MENTVPYQFIDEEIEAIFEKPPVYDKKPNCPDGFIWREEHHTISAVLTEWLDTSRKGRAAKNMRPAHARHAITTGSWGVGRYYFRVVTDVGRFFEIYYDRSPTDASDRKGHWYLLGERKPAP